MLNNSLGIVEQIEAEVEQAGRTLADHRPTHVFSSDANRAGGRARERDFIVEACNAPSGCEIRSCADRFAQLMCPASTLSQVGELASSKSAIKIFGPRVERVDHHLALGGAGDLDMAALQIGGDGRDVPRSIRSDVCGFGKEVGQRARDRSCFDARRVLAIDRDGVDRTCVVAWRQNSRLRGSGQSLIIWRDRARDGDAFGNERGS